MSVSELRKELEEFIQSDSNEVLALIGEYGVGKTYLWNETLKSLTGLNIRYDSIVSGSGRDRLIGKENYAYVSLFGVTSLGDLKKELITAIVPSRDLNSIRSRAELAGRWLINQVFEIEKVKEYSGDIVGNLAFSAVSDTLVCIDDLDRKGNHLDIKDVLGLVSNLKEHHKCKVCLILNREGFETGDDLKSYDKHVEKLIDSEILLRPDITESVEIVFSSAHPYYRWIAECCEKLKISNFRVLSKIRRNIEKIIVALSGMNDEVIKEAIHSTILFTAAKYKDSDRLPDLKFLAEYRSENIQIKKIRKEPVEEVELVWSDLLRVYGFHTPDNLDLEIIKLVQSGYIQRRDEFNEVAKEKNDSVLESAGKNAYVEAWRLFNESFSENEELFVKELQGAFRSNMNFLGMRQLQETVDVLRALERDKEANSIIDEYVAKRIGATEISFYLRGHMDFNVEDTYLADKLREIANDLTESKSLESVLAAISSGSYFLNDIEYLNAISEQEFVDYMLKFKPNNPDDGNYESWHLYSKIKPVLDFRRRSDEPYKSLGNKIQRALSEVASKSSLNKKRILNWFRLTEEELKS